jgi:hypothetical protein
MKKASEYFRNAEECKKLIATTSDPQHKTMLHRMAETWDSLAADRQRTVAQKQRIPNLEENDGTKNSAQRFFRSS